MKIRPTSEEGKLVLMALIFAFAIIIVRTGDSIGENTFFGATLKNQIAMLIIAISFTFPFFKKNDLNIVRSPLNASTVSKFLFVYLGFLISQLSGAIVATYFKFSPDHVSSRTMYGINKIFQETVGAAVIAPALEELAFRVMTLPVLIAFFGLANLKLTGKTRGIKYFFNFVADQRVVLAIVISSCFFGVSHTMSLYALVFQGTFGMLQAFVYLATGSFWLIFFLHSMFNLVLYLVNKFVVFKIEDHGLQFIHVLAFFIGILSIAATFVLFRPIFLRYYKKVIETVVPVPQPINKPSAP